MWTSCRQVKKTRGQSLEATLSPFVSNLLPTASSLRQLLVGLNRHLLCVRAIALEELCAISAKIESAWGCRIRLRSHQTLPQDAIELRAVNMVLHGEVHPLCDRRPVSRVVGGENSPYGILEGEEETRMPRVRVPKTGWTGVVSMWCDSSLLGGSAF
jgi:hypothetical protein